MTLTCSTVALHDVRLYAHHGVLPQEQTVGGWYVVDVEVEFPVGRAMKTDDVADTLDYAVLLDLVRKEMEVPSRLLEHVAGRIADAVEERFPQATRLAVRLTKENPPYGADSAGASVEMHFRKEESC